jgi:flagellar basal-body rod protein FlgC
MLSALDISTSALVAQRQRLTAIANNIANLNTTRNEQGELEPYRAKFVTFQTAESKKGAFGAAGVKVSSVETSQAEPLWRYQPSHPDAVKDGPKAGYVAYPNVNMMEEFTDALTASRAYEANVGVIEVTKDLNQQTLRLLA